MLEIRDLSVIYDERDTAVRGLNMDVPEGSVVAIVGESGSGKSTVIRSVMGLLSSGARIASGEILFHGKDLVRMPEKQKRLLRGRRMSLIFQDAAASLDPRKKIGYQYAEVLLSHMDITKAEALDKAEETLRHISMPDPGRILDSYPFELSGGMVQRVAIAMAVSMGSELLLADEPTSALDVTIQIQVVDLLMEMKRRFGTTIMLVTHNIGVASYMADLIAVMRHGELVEIGTRDEIILAPKQDYTKMLISSVPDMEVTV
ncbi:MAG: ABC transporter ATP-binding protein [Firmicutes bacterium]|nr:ABC transporter ATP-binding protein [Bacillota bacterium]MBQ6260819.1 ABC transporter ATP-binding protein [Bacillota bacterium]MBR0114571.1 ABC transporter ATP-binding protein [Bacillota bacterium]